MKLNRHNDPDLGKFIVLMALIFWVGIIFNMVKKHQNQPPCIAWTETQTTEFVREGETYVPTTTSYQPCVRRAGDK